ncbi:MAG: PspC domain-containing protein [candidate division Zixibacteria bacterium]|nr:PspC domain-containing protein [candidate division Zixibacteria bacterium]
MDNRLYRSRKNAMIAGVCGGLAEYFDIDPVVVRIIFVLLVFAGGSGLIAYLIAWIIMPQAPAENVPPMAEGVTGAAPSPETGGVDPDKRQQRTQIAGMILITVGALFLFNSLFDWFKFWKLWPVILIIFGLLILLKNKKES